MSEGKRRLAGAARHSTEAGRTTPFARASGQMAIDLGPWGFGPRRVWLAAPVGGGVVRALGILAPAGRDRSALSFSCLLRMRAGAGGPGRPSGASELGGLRGVREINGLRGRIHLALRNGPRCGEGGGPIPLLRARVPRHGLACSAWKGTRESMRGFRQWSGFDPPFSLCGGKYDSI